MSAERPPLSSVDAVRDELRRLGYLDSGLDRFVLGAAVAPSPFGACLRVALRVGLVGGVLFGAAATLGAAGVDKRLFAEPRDLLVLGVYLALALGAVAATLALGGGLVAAAAARRLGRSPGPGVSRNIGAALGVAGIAYLALWWRSHAEDAAWPAQAAAVALGLAASVLLARFGSLAAVAVLSAARAGDRLPQAQLSRRRVLPLLAAALVLVGGGTAAASYLSRRAGADAPDFAVVPTSLRVRVLAIDGLEERMTSQMIERGLMPRLGALLARGARARLRAEPEQVPAIVWTTVATGRGPEAHGIQAPAARRLAGMRSPLGLAAEGPFTRALGAAADLLRVSREQPPTAMLRSVKAFWNVASEKGLKVGVVNWWATWPAEPVNGFLVSDRAFFKLEHGEPPDREVSPASAYSELVQALPREPDRARRLDAFQVAAAARLARDAALDLEAVYLPGLDIATVQQLGDAGGSDLAALDLRLDAVRGAFASLDGLVGSFLDTSGPDDVILLVGDPGRLARRGPAPAVGLFVMAGGPAVAGDAGEVSERDVAPTVLHLLGLPVSGELEGHVVESALAPAFRAAHPVRRVERYGRRAAARAAESSFDREMMDELRSLGYIH